MVRTLKQAKNADNMRFMENDVTPTANPNPPTDPNPNSQSSSQEK
jgi:hypothetical protein